MVGGMKRRAGTLKGVRWCLALVRVPRRCVNSAIWSGRGGAKREEEEEKEEEEEEEVVQVVVDEKGHDHTSTTLRTLLYPHDTAAPVWIGQGKKGRGGMTEHPRYPQTKGGLTGLRDDLHERREEGEEWRGREDWGVWECLPSPPHQTQETTPRIT
ncbi:hypothetical protein O3P69_011406 [Scylla paramamosain]|uniref:Uncharacterized protein n=1 Tax=Scylla paramamosain TaxID=85552 RepID=A0AAW0T787_SCYPA